MLRSLMRWAPFLAEEIAGEDVVGEDVVGEGVVEEEPITAEIAIGGDLMATKTKREPCTRAACRKTRAKKPWPNKRRIASCLGAAKLLSWTQSHYKEAGLAGRPGSLLLSAEQTM